MNRFRNQPIKTKLVVIIMTASIIAIISGLAIYLIFDMSSIKNEMKKNADFNAKLVGQYSVVPLIFDYKDEAKDVLAKLNSMPSVLDACIYKANGEIFSSYHNKKDSSYIFPTPTNIKPGFSRGYLHVQHNIIFEGKNYGTLYLRLSTVTVKGKLRNNLLVMFVLIVILVVPVYLIANRLQKFISKPILNLAEITETISQTQDFTVKLEKPGNDEVGILYQQFNNFLSQILKHLKERDVAEKESTFLAQVLRNINEFVSITDTDNNITFVNQSWLTTFGYTEEEVIGEKINLIVSPSNRPGIIDEILSTTISGGWRGEVLNRRKDGSEFPVRLVTTIIYDKEDKPVFLVGISHDITYRKKTEEELKIHREHLEELVIQRTSELEIEKEHAQSADRLKSAFLATMSHELRTPLNSIIGFTGILMKEAPGPLNDEQKKQLGMVQNSARHLLSLINDILDISKIEAGQLKMNLQQFDLSEVIYKVVETNKPFADKKNLILTVSIDENINDITSDNLRVQQILLNLVNNAIKFTEIGTISINCFSFGGFVKIQITDTGMGIESEKIEQLFKPFMQIDTGLTRKHEGTGLGLSICKKLTEMLNGKIEVESKYGYGSTFTVTLPINKT
jgi:PAS domain S-box-containing protein